MSSLEIDGLTRYVSCNGESMSVISESEIRKHKFFSLSESHKII